MKQSVILFFLLLIFIALGTLFLGMMLGSKSLPISMLWDYLGQRAPYYETLIFNQRLPRTIIAFTCGGALGVAGALMQGITRNPLGDPGLLGINTGAAATIVMTAFFPNLIISNIWLAFFGAFIIAAIITILALKDRSMQQSRLILTGAAISASLFALIQAVTLWFPQTFEQYRFWSSGSFTGIALENLYALLPFLVIGFIGAMMMGKSLNILTLGSEKAKSLGFNLWISQLLILTFVALLAASTVALAGPISFIGLGAVHIARFLIGSDYRLLLPASFFSGATLLLFSDILARTLLAPSEVATGIMTALLGAPLLFILMIRKTERSI